MKVSELAKEWGATNDVILQLLKSLRLKAKDGKQELSGAVITVLKSEFIKKGGVIKKKTEAEALPEKKAEAVAPKVSKSKEEKKLKDKKAKPAKAGKTTVAKKSASGDVKKEKSKKEKVKKTVTKKEVKPKKTKTPSKAAPKTKKSEKVKEDKKDKKEKKDVARKPIKPKSSISREPVITLKPLGRKRKRVPQRDENKSGGDSGGGEASAKMILETDTSRAGLSGETTIDGQKTSVGDTSASGAAVVDDKSLADLEVRVPITVKDLSVKIQQKPSAVLKQLMQKGILAHINQSLDGDIVQAIAREFGYNIVKIKTQEEQLIDVHKKEEEDPSLLKHRAPVVTLMGHVDHGKTSLLDRIRKSKLVDSEHGGITQHMGAYSVQVPKGTITFLDTPGHEAFTAMRARGAHITDLVVLVVAADEGVMPQTEEAIDHARAADVPIVVALNKIDRKNADADRVKKQLSEKGLSPEDWGGKTVIAGVSAITGEGVDHLLEMILLESELLELKANAEKHASGIVVEAHLSQGRGAVTTLIVQSGTLKEGDFIVVGPYYGKIKAMFNDRKRAIKEAGPSMPVEILGLSNVPEAGEMFYVIEDERQARDISFRRQEQFKNRKLQDSQKITLEDLYSQIQKGSIKELSVIIKADVQGSLEALKDSLAKIPSTKVKIKFIHSGVGDVNASDVILAVASKAIIIAFHVGVDQRAKAELEKEPVDVRQYRIIYDAVNDMRKALEGLLEAKIQKKFLSRIEIREVFKLSKQGIVAGCYVTKGKVHRKANIDLVRNGEVVFSGRILSLKRFKDDVREVNEGMECGLTIEGYDKIEAGDTIEAYEVESIAQKL